MKAFSTLVILLLAIGLGALVVTQQTRGNLDFIFGTPPRQIGQNVYDFDPENVSRIHILNSDGVRGVAVKKGVVWHMTEPFSDLADPRVIDSVIKFAARLQIEDVIKRDTIEELSDLGLRKDRIELELFNTDGSPICNFKIGRGTLWKGFDATEEVPPGQDPSVFPTYFIRPDEDGMEDYLYVCSDIANQRIRDFAIRSFFVQDLQFFRGRQVFPHSPRFAAEITIAEKNSEITLKRDSLSPDSPWEIAKPFQLSSNPAAIKRLLGLISNLSAAQAADPETVSLPNAVPENVDLTVSVKSFRPDGSVRDPVTAYFYPPVTENAPNIPVKVRETDGTLRNAVLAVPHGPKSVLSQLPRSVNELRSRTLSSMAVRDLDQIEIRDHEGRYLKLALELDPHERARRWQAVAGSNQKLGDQLDIEYQGPANELRTKDLFEFLCQDEVKEFATDAATDLTAYGFDQPRYRIKITRQNGKLAHFIVGEVFETHFYARNTAGGRLLEISEEAYQAAQSGKMHRDLALVAKPGNANKSPLPLADSKKVTIRNQSGNFRLELGRRTSRHFYANRLTEDQKTTSHVVELKDESVSKLVLDSFRWRSARVWNLSPFEITGITVQKQGGTPIELGHDFYAEKWTATQGPKDVTANLSPYKAEKLLEDLTDIRVQSWLSDDAQNAAFRLEEPQLKIVVRQERLGEDGERLDSTYKTLTLAQIVPGVPNRLYYGKTSEHEGYFLVEVAVVQKLAVDLLED